MIVPWTDFEWPEWVPEGIRTSVESFWSESAGRGPRSWIADMKDQGGPKFGSVATCRALGAEEKMVTGRFVHCWNNIGRVVHDDGSFDYVSYTTAQFRRPRSGSQS